MPKIFSRTTLLHGIRHACHAFIVPLCLFGLPAPAVCASTGHQAFFVCTDYHCDIGETVRLAPGQWQSVRDLFMDNTSPAEERERIRQAIALLETMVGSITGTWRDKGGNVAGSGEPGQLDCISESRNTTTYLQLLFDDGLLKWHEVGDRRLRHPLIFNDHWTAVITDNSNGHQYAVDSWFLDNGEPPGVLPLSDWLRGRDPDE